MSLKIATWSIVNNEISFIKDIIDYHLKWVDFMYILDTGSTDGTLEFIQEYARTDPRVIADVYPVKYKTQYELQWHEMVEPFPEVTVRNYAISKVKDLHPDWIIQLDGDEVFLDITRTVISEYKNKSCIAHSTINPVCKLSEFPIEQRDGKTFYDPHVRIWNAKNSIYYIENPAFKGKQYHCVPTFDHGTTHLFHHSNIKFVSDPIMHYHLHWMYGSKMELFFNKKNVFNNQEMVIGQEKNKFSEALPKIFWDKRDIWLIQ